MLRIIFHLCFLFLPVYLKEITCNLKQTDDLSNCLTAEKEFIELLTISFDVTVYQMEMKEISIGADIDTLVITSSRKCTVNIPSSFSLILSKVRTLKIEGDLSFIISPEKNQNSLFDFTLSELSEVIIEINAFSPEDTENVLFKFSGVKKMSFSNSNISKMTIINIENAREIEEITIKNLTFVDSGRGQNLTQQLSLFDLSKSKIETLEIYGINLQDIRNLKNVVFFNFESVSNLKFGEINIKNSVIENFTFLLGNTEEIQIKSFNIFDSNISNSNFYQNSLPFSQFLFTNSDIIRTKFFNQENLIFATETNFSDLIFKDNIYDNLNLLKISSNDELNKKKVTINNCKFINNSLQNPKEHHLSIVNFEKIGNQQGSLILH
jgi:hypothetical protein